VKTDYYEPCPQRSITAQKIDEPSWQQIVEVLENPDLVLRALEAQRNTYKPATIEAEIVLVENNIANSVREETNYLRQYGRGKIDEARLDTEIERVKRYKIAQEASLSELNGQLKQLDDLDTRYQKASEALEVIAENLDNADYSLKQLALKALEIKATLNTDHNLTMRGTIPVEVPQYATTSSHWWLLPWA
jgi:hypothetical protein